LAGQPVICQEIPLWFHRALLKPTLLKPALLLCLSMSLVACAQQDSTQQRPTSTLAQPTSTLSSTPSPTPTSAASPASSGRVVEVTYAGGSVTGAAQRVAIKLGERVVLRVTSDVTEEIHVHGYDLYADLAPGQPKEIAFIADIPGVFEVELHNAGRPLYQLRVA
jgi:hypothetical protein